MLPWPGRRVVTKDEWFEPWNIPVSQEEDQENA